MRQRSFYIEVFIGHLQAAIPLEAVPFIKGCLSGAKTADSYDVGRMAAKRGDGAVSSDA